MRLAKYAVFITLLAPCFSTAYSQEKSEYVPLQADSCRVLDGSVNDHYLSRGLIVSECLTNATVQSSPLRLFIVSTDERSWIDLVIGNTIWSSEEEIVYERENQFGFFPNVANAPAELRTSSLNVMGLIFRVTAQNPDQQSTIPGSSTLSRLFVIGFRGSGVCFVGTTNDNATARSLLNSDVSCKRMLKVAKLSTVK